jgi:hypothetical protein
MHPFAELTNRTPSPSQKDDAYARKHSPWTAARHKKKTRSVQEQSGDTLPVFQQAIPETFVSPGTNVKIQHCMINNLLAPLYTFAAVALTQ